MKRTALALVATLLLLTPTMENVTTLGQVVPADETGNPLDGYIEAQLKYRAWLKLCFEYAGATDRSCWMVKPPKVVFEKMRQGLRGYYDGGDTVYVNENLKGIQKEATLIHEMSHYLDTRLGLNPPMPVYRGDTEGIFGLCMSEKRAWDLTDEFWRDQSWGSKAVDGQWVEWYDHCRPFADKLYPERYKRPLPEASPLPWFLW